MFWAKLELMQRGPQVSIETKDLKKGMRLQEDLYLENGTLFTLQGFIVIRHYCM